MRKSIRGSRPGAVGRDEAISALFDQNFMPLRRLALHLLRDPELAEEVVMDAFVKVCSRWKSIESLDWPPGYLRKVVVNMCRSKLRRRSVESRFLGGRAGAESRFAIEPIESVFDPSLARAIDALPERQRIALVLHYVEDLALADIAELMDCSVGTIKSQLSKARSRLSEIFAPPNSSDGCTGGSDGFR